MMRLKGKYEKKKETKEKKGGGKGGGKLTPISEAEMAALTVGQHLMM